jgi:hypothetical protein
MRAHFNYKLLVLRINRIENKHFGKYMCKAINKLGSDFKEIELRDSPNAVCPPACGIGYAGYIGHASAIKSNFTILSSLALLSFIVHTLIGVDRWC